jgi:hypothetical protein
LTQSFGSVNLSPTDNNAARLRWITGARLSTLVTLRTPSGIIFHNEVGYTMPTWPKNSTDGERKMAAAKGILREVPNGVHILSADRDETIPTPRDHSEGTVGW